MIIEVEHAYAKRKCKRVLQRKREQRLRDEVYFHDILYVMDYDKYFEGHVTSMKLKNKRLLSNNNWYFQKTKMGVNTSTRLFSIAANAYAPLIFQDKSSTYYDKKKRYTQRENGRKEQKKRNNDNDDSNSDDDSSSDDEEEALIAARSNNNIVSIIDDEGDVETSESSKDSSCGQCDLTSNQQFGLVAYNLQNIETMTTNLVISQPGDITSIQPCNFDMSGGKFVYSYAKHITGSKENKATIQSVESWLSKDVPPKPAKTDPAPFDRIATARFIQNRFGAHHKNVFDRVLQLNAVIKKTPLCDYQLGPYSSIANTHYEEDENSLVASLPTMPFLTSLAEPKYASHNVDLAHLNKCAMLALGTHDPEQARATIIQNYLIEQRIQRQDAANERKAKADADPTQVEVAAAKLAAKEAKEVAKAAAKEAKDAAKAAKAAAKAAAKDAKADANAPTQVHAQAATEADATTAIEDTEALETADIADTKASRKPVQLDYKELLYGIMFDEQWMTKYRQLNVKIDTVLRPFVDVVQIANKPGEFDRETFALYMCDVLGQHKRANRKLKVQLSTGREVVVDLKDVYLLQSKIE